MAVPERNSVARWENKRSGEGHLHREEAGRKGDIITQQCKESWKIVWFWNACPLMRVPQTTQRMNMVSSENEALLQNKTDLLSQLHDLVETRKNALDAVSSMHMRYLYAQLNSFTVWNRKISRVVCLFMIYLQTTVRSYNLHRMNLLEEENTRLQKTAAQMCDHIESLTILSETDCSVSIRLKLLKLVLDCKVHGNDLFTSSHRTSPLRFVW